MMFDLSTFRQRPFLIAASFMTLINTCKNKIVNEKVFKLIQIDYSQIKCAFYYTEICCLLLTNGSFH